MTEDERQAWVQIRRGLLMQVAGIDRLLESTQPEQEAARHSTARPSHEARREAAFTNA